MSKRTMAGGIPREVMVERETAAWDMRQQGLTHERIALELNLERSTISKMLTRIAKRANNRIIDEAVTEKITQISRLNFIVDEAMQAWARSKEASKLVRRSQNEPAPAPVENDTDADGFQLKRGRGRPAGSVNKTVTVSQVTDQDGDPRYLSEARAAMADIRKLMGLDAPARNFNVNLDLLSDEQLERLAAGDDIIDIIASGKELDDV